MTATADAYAWPPVWARDLVPATADVDRSAVYLAIEAASWPSPTLAPAERRAFALVVLASLDSRGGGATRLESRDGRRPPRAARRCGRRPHRGRAAGRGAACPPAPRGLRRAARRLPAVHRRRRLPVPRARPPAGAAPRRRDRRTPGWPGDAPAASTGVEGRWTQEQIAAIDAARRRSLTVISGGPGTGKTALIGGIVRAWLAAGIGRDAIAIAAPTGKAANRIAELLSDAPDAPVPATLHRLLGLGGGAVRLRGGEFRHHENRPLPHAAVIVDEASMVGLSLMEQLSRALAPGARLVLIGDGDQLPAVDVGSVFRDLVATGPTFRLTESHRMNPADPAGAAVLDAARAIAAGDLAGRGTPAARTPAELGAAGLVCLEPDGETPQAARRSLSAFIDHWYATWIRPGADAARQSYALRADNDSELAPDAAAAAMAALARQQRSRLLTVTRGGFAGADRINSDLARRAAVDAGLPAPAGDVILPGTPVMITRNDYDRGLYNGDQGVVLTVVAGNGGRPTPAAVFQRGGALVPFPLTALHGALALAYASTVHKAQGSELDTAALILPDADMPLLSRELVYTAVTRVRRSITVVGRRELLERAVARPLERSSGLAERIAAVLASDRLRAR